MGNSLYAVRENGLCPACRFPRDSAYHYRLHVPRDRWPDSMRTGAPRVEHGPYERATVAMVDGTNDFMIATDDGVLLYEGVGDPIEAVSGEASVPGSDALPEVADAGASLSPEAAPSTLVCECGRAAASPAGLAAHRRHCEVTHGQ